MMRRKLNLDYMPFDMAFDVPSVHGMNRELCHCTGYEVCLGNPSNPADWWNEYVDSLGGLHYGR